MTQKGVLEMLTPCRVVGMTVWRANADEYKLCCRSVHVRRGALVVGLAGIAIAILAAILLTLAYAWKEDLWNELWRSPLSSHNDVIFVCSYILLLVLTTSDLLACYLLVYGVVQQHSAYLLPFVCVNLVSIATLLFLICFTIAAVVCAIDINYIFLTVMLVGFLIAFVVGLWALTIVWRCYIYLVDKKMAEEFDQGPPTSFVNVMVEEPSCSGTSGTLVVCEDGVEERQVKILVDF